MWADDRWNMGVSELADRQAERWLNMHTLNTDTHAFHFYLPPPTWPNWTGGSLSRHNSPRPEWPGCHNPLPLTGQTETNTHTPTLTHSCTHDFHRAAVLLGQWSGEQTNVPPARPNRSRSRGVWMYVAAASPHLHLQGGWVFSTITLTRCPAATPPCSLYNLLGKLTGLDRARHALVHRIQQRL